MRRTKEDAEKTKKELLDAAFYVFKNQGYRSAKLEDIAARANVTRGAIAWHFTNKQNIYHALIEKSKSDTTQIVNDIFEQDIPPNEKIDGFVKVLIQKRHKLHIQVNVLNNILKERPKEFEDSIAIIEGNFNFIIETLTATLQEGIDAGIFKKHVNPSFTARAIYTFIWGFLTDFEILYSDYSEDEIMENTLRFFNEILNTNNNVR